MRLLAGSFVWLPDLTRNTLKLVALCCWSGLFGAARFRLCMEFLLVELLHLKTKLLQQVHLLLGLVLLNMDV